MAFEVRLTSKASPRQVLDAIKENAREWRESVIPRPVRRNGVLQVVAEIKAPEFTLRYDRRNEGIPVRLEGSVRASADGGTELSARCGARQGGVFAAVIFAVLGLVNFFRANDGGGVAVWFVLAAGFWAIDVYVDHRVSRSNVEAAYLEKRLEQAVAAADGSPSAVVSPAPD